MQKAQFGMIGLGTMGRNLVLNMADHDISVCGYDPNPAQQQRLLEEGAGKPVQTAASLPDFINSLEHPRRVMLLVPAGTITDSVIDEVSALLQPGDILIDGGNAHYADTNRRIENLKDTGIHFTGMGVSGGEDGARLGPSLMPGGNRGSYAELKPIFDKIAASTADGPCVAFVGNGSAGHYTKMVHNGIEYAIMQLISEVYSILKNACGCTNEEMHQIFDEWNKGKLQSFLVEITAKIFLQKDDVDPNQYLLDMILDKAKQKGTGIWTSESALQLAIPTTVIDEAVNARVLSSFKTDRQVVDSFNPDKKLAIPPADKAAMIMHLHNALYFGMAISYVQGMHLIKTASDTYHYEIDQAAIVRIWKGGCIIRSLMLNDIGKVFSENPSTKNLLLNKAFYDNIQQHKNSVAEVLKLAIDNELGTPVLSSGLQYFYMFSSGRMASNMIQAQRDFFGAHTYERTDKEGSFHTNWS
jgi:6-phosphogluconate dehydrogenase